MRIPEAQIEKAASNDPERLSISVVRLDTKNKRLIAADGRILACVPVEIEESDVSCSIPLVMFDVLRSLGARFVFVENEKCIIPGVAEFNNVPYTYPVGTSEIIEHAENAIENGKHIFTLDVRLLSRLADAIGSHFLKFYRMTDDSKFDDSKFKETVLPINGEGLGVIMGMHR